LTTTGIGKAVGIVMYIKRTVKVVENFSFMLSRIINGVGVSLIMAMMFLTVSDVLLRYVFNRPIPGSYELIKFMMLIVVFYGLAYTAVKRGHISIDLVLIRLPHRTQAVINTITWAFSFGLFCMVTWRSLLLTKMMWQRGDVSTDLLLPIAPILLCATVGLIALSLVLLGNFLNSLYEVMRK
jgi:TRAP-type C4-dicarboxylate transport system permease small subunit